METMPIVLSTLCGNTFLQENKGRTPHLLLNDLWRNVANLTQDCYIHALQMICPPHGEGGQKEGANAQ